MITKKIYVGFKENSVIGRYVTNDHITGFLKGIADRALVETIGHSVEKRLIHSVTIGTGKYKLLLWSQMHGNESTTTKAVLDLLNFLTSDALEAKQILRMCSFKIIPILNPDGAAAYTRVNANQIDLNRDAQDLTQPESKVLRSVYEEFMPDFCFNLHDQRTIFNAGATNQPATVSFLAPAYDEARNISTSRGISMQLIVAMNRELQKLIPGQVGRYDDGFNANCVGDTFQMLGKPTILFEAGHFSNDYLREETRYYIFQALVTAAHCISEEQIDAYQQKEYFEIPENQKGFFDILIKKASRIHESYTHDIGILFKEVLENDKITFQHCVVKEENLVDYFGHQTFDCSNEEELNLLQQQDFWQLLKH